MPEIQPARMLSKRALVTIAGVIVLMAAGVGACGADTGDPRASENSPDPVSASDRVELACGIAEIRPDVSPEAFIEDADRLAELVPEVELEASLFTAAMKRDERPDEFEQAYVLYLILTGYQQSDIETPLAELEDGLCGDGATELSESIDERRTTYADFGCDLGAAVVEEVPDGKFPDPESAPSFDVSALASIVEIGQAQPSPEEKFGAIGALYEGLTSREPDMDTIVAEFEAGCS